jgi:hypothetical protein
MRGPSLICGADKPFPWRIASRLYAEHRSGSTMAKRCEVCNQEYSDHEPACPHCQAAAAQSSHGTDDDIFANLGEEESATDAAQPEVVAVEDEVIAVEDSGVHLGEPVAAEAGAAPSDEPLEILEVGEASKEPQEQAPAVVDDLVEVKPEGAVEATAEEIQAAETEPAPDVLEIVPETAAEAPLTEEEAASIFDDTPAEEAAAGRSGSHSSDVMLAEPSSDVALVDSGSDVLVVDEPVLGFETPPGEAAPPAAEAEAAAEPAAAEEAPAEAAPSEPAPPQEVAPPLPEMPAAAAEPPALRNPTFLRPVAPVTQLAGQQPMPTMLAPPDHGTQEEPGAHPPGAAAETVEAGAAAIPNLSLDSGDLLAEPAEGGETVGPVELGEEEMVAGAPADAEGAVDLGEVEAGAMGPVSGLDPVAEALESGVDLTPEEAVEVGSEDLLAAGGESSAVDLGATAPMPDTDEEAAELAVGQGQALDATLPFEEGAGVAADDLLAEAPVDAVEEAAADALLEPEATDAEEVAADALLDEGSTEAVEEAAAADLLADEETVAPAEAAEEVENAEEAAEAVDEEEELVAAGAGRKGRGAPALDEQRAGRGYPRPRYGRRWLAGTMLGILLCAGGAAAVWYFAPQLLEEIPASPNAPKKVVQPSAPKGPRATPVQEALVYLHQNDLDQAWDLLKPEPKEVKPSKETLSARGEVRWLKYVKQQQAKKRPLRADDDDVKLALKDLKDAENTLLAQQISNTLVRAELASKGTETEQGLRDLLIKAKAVTEDDPKAKDLAAAVTQLVNAKQIQAKQLAAAAAELTKAKEDLEQAQKVVGEIGTQVGAKDAIPAKVKDLVDARNDLDAKLAKVNADLKKAGAKDVAELVERRDKLEADKKTLTATLVQALKELTPDAAPPAADLPKRLLESVILVREKAKSPLVNAVSQIASSLGGLGAGTGQMVQRALDRTSAEALVRFFQAREPLIQTPEQKLNTWIALFEDRDRKGGKEAESAARDARWVMSEGSRAAEEARARASYLAGLLARSEGKYAEARKRLEAAVKQAETLAPPPKDEWPARAAKVLKELTDPSAYYLPRAERLHAEGQLQDTLAVLNTGLEVIPGDPHMLALRSLVRVEMAPSPAKLKEVEKEIRADAEAARKDVATAAAAYYALGRLEEELGQLGRAEEDYRAALKAHRGDPAQASRYRIALARLLQRELAPAAEPTPAAPAGKAEGGAGEESEEPEQTTPQARAARPLAALAVLVMTGVQGPAVDEEDPRAAARLKESIELARELIKSEDPKTKGQGYMLLGLAYSRQGQRTLGLNEYLKGLELVHPGQATRDLLKLIEQHPAFQQPESLGQPNAVLAEAHYGKGLYLYWGRQYAQAEAELQKAVQYYGQDARYRYYLGLARLAQRTRPKREAASFDFEQGAKLEAEGRPGTVIVNSSLERVQGTLREYLDSFRDKGATGGR